MLPVGEIDVILPVLDEREALPGVLAAMPAGYRAIVVDNGSTDGSGDLARSLGVEVVDQPQRGYGAACHAGFEAATNELVCVMDCDGSLDPGELPAVVEPVAADRLDLCLGRRVADRGAWPLHARFANRALAAELRRRTGAPLTDLGPVRACRRTPLLDLGVEDRRFGYPLETVLRATRAGWRIGEVPVRYAERQGRSKVTGTLRGTARAVKDMTEVLR